MVVGRLHSYWEGNFSGAMLNFGRVGIGFGFHASSAPVFNNSDRSGFRRLQSRSSAGGEFFSGFQGLEVCGGLTEKGAKNHRKKPFQLYTKKL